MTLCLSLILLCGVIYCNARPDGAPESACLTLTPFHAGLKAQNDAPPYIVNATRSGEKVKVTISSPIGEEFGGFVLQARSSNDRTKFVDGEFTASAISKATNCFAGIENTLTHRNAEPKKEVVTLWTPRSPVNEDIVFRATVAKTFAAFWTEIDSSPVKINSVDTEKHSGAQSYDYCSSKGCFGLPSGCAETNDCEVLLTYSRVQEGIQFSMRGNLDSSMYMAMGLSTDPVMGNDSVTECIRDGSDVIARESWNEGKSNTRTYQLSKDSYHSSFTDGVSYCSWVKPYIFKSNAQQFNLDNTKYHLLLAHGDVENGRLKYHTERLASAKAVDFSVIEADDEISTSEKISETTKFYTPTTAHETDDFEVKSTSASKNTHAENKVGDGKGSSCNLQLSFSVLFLVFLQLLFATNRSLFASLS